MDSNILGTAELMGTVVGTSAGVMVLEESLAGKISWFVAGCTDEITFINDCGTDGRVVEGTNP